MYNDTDRLRSWKTVCPYCGAIGWNILLLTIFVSYEVIIIIYLFLIRRKLTYEYDQMRLTTITTCNNYNKIYLKNT